MQSLVEAGQAMLGRSEDGGWSRQDAEDASDVSVDSVEAVGRLGKELVKSAKHAKDVPLGLRDLGISTKRLTLKNYQSLETSKRQTPSLIGSSHAKIIFTSSSPSAPFRPHHREWARIVGLPDQVERHPRQTLE
jgi:hypothetical protein